MDEDPGMSPLANLRALLELDSELGVWMLPRSPRVERAASRAPARPSPVGRQPAPSAGRAAPERGDSAATRPTCLPPVDGSFLDDLAVADDPAEALAAIATRVAACDRCGLAAGRSTAVPGEGCAQPEVLFVGEGPGAEEDRQGRPFVGPAGQLLDRMIAAMGFTRAEVFIANIVKCRPPGNRNPEPNEVAACLPYLSKQVAILRPKVVCTLGNVPLRALTDDLRRGITRARGQRFTWQGLPVVPTFHPSYLLRNPAAKKNAWEDLKQVLALLGRTPPTRGG